MRTFNITPLPRMLLGVQNQKWTVSGALAELIDNAFGPGRGNADIVKIIFDVNNRTLTVVDDGKGMEYIGRLFQLGNTIGRTAGDIGHFGSGGTQAILWLAEWVRVATSRNNAIMHDRVRWSEIFDMSDFRDIAVSNEWQLGNFAQFSDWSHGTSIQMKLMKTRRITVSNVMRDLSRLFAPGLRAGKTIIWCQKRAGENIEEHQLSDPFEVSAGPENTVRFNFVVEYEDAHLPAHGVITFNENTSHHDSLVRIGLGYREILRTRDCFASDTEAFAGIGVSGWLDLGDGWQPYLSTTKDAFNDQPLYETLMAHIFRKIRNLLVQAEQRTIDFELDNLAIGLEVALQKTMQMKISIGRDSGDDTTARSDADSGSKSNTPGDDKEGTAVAHIRLVKQTDDDMMGVLTRAGSDPKGIYVDINQDHAYVREAMLQRPINAAALNLMIITEIAALLTGDPILAHKAFKQTLIDELDRREGYEKQRMLIRHLVDSIPDKQHRVAAE